MSRMQTITVEPTEWYGATNEAFRRSTLDAARKAAKNKWACVRIVTKSKLGHDVIATIDYRFWTYEEEERQHDRLEAVLQSQVNEVIEEMRLKNVAEEEAKRARRRERARAIRQKLRVPDFVVE